MPSSRLRAVWMAKRPRSQVIQRRFSFSATAAVVPLPQKQSRTRSSSLEESPDDAFEESFGFLGWIIESFGVTL